MQPGNKRLPKLTKQSLLDLHVIYKYIIHKSHINTFAKIIIIEDVPCEACFSRANFAQSCQ